MRKQLMLAFAIGLLATQGAMAQSFNMKIAHLLPPGDPRDQGAHAVADYLHNDDRCDIEVSVFPSGQLGGFTEINEGVQFGSIEMSVQPVAYMAPIEPLSAILDFPFFWPTDVDQLLELHKGEAISMIGDAFERHGIVMLDVWHTGFMQWTANDPLTSLDDFDGKVARVMPSQLMTKRQELFGLNPVTMPFSETYSALQTGALDAQENPIPTSYNMKFHEVQDYLTLTSHGTLDQYVSVNKGWWDGLTADCRAAIQDAMPIGNEVTLTETKKQEVEYLAAMEEAGITVVELSEEQRAAMREAVLPGVTEWWLDITGDEGQAVLDKFETEIQALQSQ